MTRKLVSILWIETSGDEVNARMRMLKLWRDEEYIADDMQPEISYCTEEIEPENHHKAIDFCAAYRYKPHGVWYAGHPGIAFAPHTQEINGMTETARAIRDLARAGTSIHVQYEHIIPAPVRFVRSSRNMTYRYIASKRTMKDLQRLRAKYRDAGELAWTPEDVASHARDRFGRPQATYPLADWTVAWPGQMRW